MSMYDDLDPGFVPPIAPALANVAARVRRLRFRRVVRLGALGGVVAVVVGLTANSLLGGSGPPHQLTVSKDVTTTTGSPTTARVPRATVAPTSTSKPTTTTASTTTVPVTVPVTKATTPRTLSPGHVTIAFDRADLTIASGAGATVSYTLTNRDAGSGSIALPACPNPQLWPDHVSRTAPVLWAVPVSPVVECSVLQRVTVAGHTSRTFHLTLVAGQFNGVRNQIVPAPPGRTTFAIGRARLAVTIAAPTSAPITVAHPSAVTTGSNMQHWVDFTITNNLPFPVRYVDQGPCSSDIGVPCNATTPDGAVTGDLRLAPYATGKKPLYLTHFLLGAHETKTARAQVHGTTSMEDIGLGSPAMPPGVYAFDWDGQKVTFTVTP